jgi:hypothetical protein
VVVLVVVVIVVGAIPTFVMIRHFATACCVSLKQDIKEPCPFGDKARWAKNGPLGIFATLFTELPSARRSIQLEEPFSKL